MNLVIDVGNTFVKFGIFDLEGLQYKKSCKKSDFLDVLNTISSEFPNIQHVFMASVGDLDAFSLEKLGHHYTVMHLNQETNLPFDNKYTTPKTLGTDRIALISAAVQQFPHQNVLVIDTGTCITYDFVNSETEYLGGAISPGLAMRYRALNSFTEKLPLLSCNMPKTLIGNSTADSIHSGVVHGVLYEMERFIENYNCKFAGLKVVLTGGDADFLHGSIKNDIFASSNFLLEGLNHILEYNIR